METTSVFAFRRESMETPVPVGEAMTFDSEQNSPTPGVDMSSYSSPGSASDNMGSAYSSSQNIQPLLPGSSVLASFDRQQKQGVGLHMNRVINTKLSAGGNASEQQQDDDDDEDDDETKPPGERRQKRLERNRESARLSRRRRKQYLEVLEHRVNQISFDLDKLRRDHVLRAVSEIASKRLSQITAGRVPEEPALSRTSNELMVATTFEAQQLKSFSIPPSMRFVLWLSVQTETYFRGGRAPSERLSAARIGEKMVASGTTKADPSQSMWPLLCNEIGLSYDQEEKFRNYQRQVIQDEKTWVDRHTVYASNRAIQSAHDAVQALTLRAGQRERSMSSILTTQQRSKLLSWSVYNRKRMYQSVQRILPSCSSLLVTQRETSSQNHPSANLYILADRLNKVLEIVPPAAPLVTGKRLKKLSRRPCFESLGSVDEKPMQRENSSGSLKRDASEMSMDDDENSKPSGTPSICPVDAQAKAGPVLQQALGFIHDLLPPAPAVVLTSSTLSTYLTSEINYDDPLYPMPILSQPEQPVAAPVLSYTGSYYQSAPVLGSLSKDESKHIRKSSFLPAHLHVVPEEMWPGDEAEEFLLDVLDGDEWAIGEGIDMDNM